MVVVDKERNIKEITMYNKDASGRWFTGLLFWCTNISNSMLRFPLKHIFFWKYACRYMVIIFMVVSSVAVNINLVIFGFSGFLGIF